MFVSVWTFLKTICKSKRGKDTRCVEKIGLYKCHCSMLFYDKRRLSTVKCKSFATSISLICDQVITVLYYCKYRYIEKNVHFGCPNWVRPYKIMRCDLLATNRMKSCRHRREEITERSDLRFSFEAKRSRCLDDDVVSHESFPTARRRRSTH